MRTRLHAAALGVAFALGACAWALLPHPKAYVWPPQPGVRVVLTREAEASITNLARLTRRTRREHAACVVDYAVLPMSRDSVLVGLLALGPSAPYVSESLWVRTRDGRDFCAAAQPNVHTHIVANEVWGRPSWYDSAQAAQWQTVPFRVLVSVSDTAVRVVVYALQLQAVRPR